MASQNEPFVEIWVSFVPQGKHLMLTVEQPEELLLHTIAFAKPPENMWGKGYHYDEDFLILPRRTT